MIALHLPRRRRICGPYLWMDFFRRRRSDAAARSIGNLLAFVWWEVRLGRICWVPLSSQFVCRSENASLQVVRGAAVWAPVGGRRLAGFGLVGSGGGLAHEPLSLWCGSRRRAGQELSEMVGLHHPPARVLGTDACFGSTSLSGRRVVQGLRAEAGQDRLDDRGVIEHGARDGPRLRPMARRSGPGRARRSCRTLPASSSAAGAAGRDRRSRRVRRR